MIRKGITEKEIFKLSLNKALRASNRSIISGRRGENLAFPRIGIKSRAGREGGSVRSSALSGFCAMTHFL